jgi:hypothetical protein
MRGLDIACNGFPHNHTLLSTHLNLEDGEHFTLNCVNSNILQRLLILTLLYSS